MKGDWKDFTRNNPTRIKGSVLEIGPRTEHEEAVALMQKVNAFEERWSCLKWFHHIDNGRATKAQAGRKKVEGTKKGVADYFLPAARGGYHGLYVELKAIGGKLTKEQRAFLLAMMQQGYAAECCEGADAAWDVIRRYLEERPL